MIHWSNINLQILGDNTQETSDKEFSNPQLSHSYQTSQFLDSGNSAIT